MTVGDYIASVRTKLRDDVQPYRFPDTDIATSLNEALRRARQVRPSLAYKDMTRIEIADDANFAGYVSAPVRSELDNYSEALVFIAAARVLGNDNADTSNAAVADKWRASGLELLAI